MFRIQLSRNKLEDFHISILERRHEVSPLSMCQLEGNQELSVLNNEKCSQISLSRLGEGFALKRLLTYNTASIRVANLFIIIHA